MKLLHTFDTGLKHLNGRELTVIRVITEPDDEHDVESLPMYVVRIEKEDGVFELFSDEVMELD